MRKFKESLCNSKCSKRTFTNVRLDNLNESILKDHKVGPLMVHKLNFKWYSFAEIMKERFDLKPCVFNDALAILKVLQKNYKELCKNYRFENVMIAACLFSMEKSGLPCYVDSVKSIDQLISQIWHKEEHKAMLVQVYSIFQNLEDLFSEDGSWIGCTDNLLSNCTDNSLKF
jgi:hypothetical protein